jgi:hypothetical protein
MIYFSIFNFYYHLSSIIDKMTFALFLKALLMLGVELRKSSRINDELMTARFRLEEFDKIMKNKPSERWLLSSWLRKSKSRRLKE